MRVRSDDAFALSICRATADDTTETAAVFSAAFNSLAFVQKLHSDAEDCEFIRGCISRCEMWIAVQNERIVGLACVDGDLLAHLYVHPESRNRGIGTALLDHVKVKRPDGFQFWTFQANAGARRFYERHGCVAVEFTDGSTNEQRLPDVRYEWRP